MNIKYSIRFLIIAMVLVSCASNEDQQEKEVLREDTLTSGELSLSESQFEHAGIEYGSIQKYLLSSDVNARGELVLPVNSKADMVSLYPGIVQAIFINRGEPVSKGQVLATINSPDFIEAQQQYLMVKNQIIMLEQEYERQKELNKEKIASDKYFQRSLADYNVAMAELKGLAIQLEMAGISEKVLQTAKITRELRIISPLNGYIENINANPGKYVNPDESLFQVINRDKLLIELNVFEKDILKVAPGQRVTFTLANMSQEIHEAKIISVGNTVHEVARVVKVLAEFRNESGRLLPGMFVASHIHTGETEVNALPEEAVLRIADDYYVIFYTTPAMQKEWEYSYKSIPVKVGYMEDGFIEIEPLSELPSDAMIVVKGGYYLKTEKAKQKD
jgi:cobalt-zinc-cadmium efflux system membrane fusion protein